MSSSSPRDAPGSGPLRQACETYGRVLGRAGGAEVALWTGGQDRRAIGVALYVSPPYDLRLPPLAVSRLSINLTASPLNGGVDGGCRRSFMARRHSMFLMPAGMPAHWCKPSPSRHLNIYFDAADGRDELGRALRQGGPVFNRVLPGSGALIEQLAREMSEAGPFSTEATESLVLLLLVELWRRRARKGEAEPISARLVARLDEYISANLGERILVADLAHVADLPAAAFAVAFTRFTGRSPHQHVLMRRVEQAAAMLRAGQGSLAEVAAACGFASQQHMTQVLRVRLGTTPAVLRGAASTASASVTAARSAERRPMRPAPPRRSKRGGEGPDGQGSP